MIIFPKYFVAKQIFLEKVYDRSVGFYFGYLLKVDLILAIISGPDLPIPLNGHSMISLGLGQAILGGYGNSTTQSKIYLITCSEHIFVISVLSKELSVPRGVFVAIPIPDSMSGCISASKLRYLS